jgi:dihydroorotate dehydrogenase (NAD+) catalytic subunit
MITFESIRGRQLDLASEVMIAAGCGGDGRELLRVRWIAEVGAYVTRTLTVSPARGFPGPRLLESRGGVLYEAELPNRGLEREADRLGQVWAALPVPVIVSIAASRISDFGEMATQLEHAPGVGGIELNLELLADPDTGRLSPAAVERAVDASAGATSLVVLAKLAPEKADGSLLKAAAEGGAAAAVVGHGWPATDSATLRPDRLGGPAILPLTLRVVETPAQNAPIPIVACGGIDELATARAYLEVGAAAVQIGTALLRDPDLAARIARDLRHEAVPIDKIE